MSAQPLTPASEPDQPASSSEHDTFPDNDNASVSNSDRPETDSEEAPSPSVSVNGNKGGRSEGEEEDEQDFDELRSRSGFNESGGGLYTVHGERSYNNTSWVYRFPADQEEVLRQDRQHYVMAHSLPGLYRGPVEEILNDTSRHRRLLDIGCGTGIWTQEMAELFPHVDCIGVDIVPLQHDHHLKNCTFMCVNAPDGLRVFAPYSFDVIHMRQMLHATDAYPRLLEEAYKLLRKGGVLLLHEPQLQFYSQWEGFTASDLAPATSRLLDALMAAFASRGARPELFHVMEQILVDAGFELDDVDTYYHYRQACPEDPQSEWGRNESENSASFVRAARLLMMEEKVLEEEEFDELALELTEEVQGRSKGAAGPLGAQGVVSPWGYWWALKR